MLEGTVLPGPHRMLTCAGKVMRTGIKPLTKYPCEIFSQLWELRMHWSGGETVGQATLSPQTVVDFVKSLSTVQGLEHTIRHSNLYDVLLLYIKEVIFCKNVR